MTCKRNGSSDARRHAREQLAARQASSRLVEAKGGVSSRRRERVRQREVRQTNTSSHNSRQLRSLRTNNSPVMNKRASVLSLPMRIVRGICQFVVTIVSLVTGACSSLVLRFGFRNLIAVIVGIVLMISLVGFLAPSCTPSDEQAVTIEVSTPVVEE